MQQVYSSLNTWTTAVSVGGNGVSSECMFVSHQHNTKQKTFRSSSVIWLLEFNWKYWSDVHMKARLIRTMELIYGWISGVCLWLERPSFNWKTGVWTPVLASLLTAKNVPEQDTECLTGQHTWKLNSARMSALSYLGIMREAQTIQE